MDRFGQAQALVQRAKEQTGACRDKYELSLHAKHIDAGLLIEIKQIVDGLRSALDYCARELFARLGHSKGAPNIYFPISKKGAKAADFPELLNTRIPGVVATRPDLASLLSSFQEFAHPDNAWLPDLATLSNENKHENLSAQTRTETPELRVESRALACRSGEGPRSR